MTAQPVPVDPGKLRELRAEAAGCTSCGLSATRTQVVVGEGDPAAGLLVVGEAPGAEEDRTGRPFVGRSGQLLSRLLAEETGLRRDDCFITNVVKCRPPGNRNPSAAEVAACRPWLDQQVALMAPAAVLNLGNFSTRLLLSTKDGITTLRGRSYQVEMGGRTATVVPTLHPAAVLRGGKVAEAQVREDLRRVAALLQGFAA
ncbi:MAG: uracil-DNA glycosylase family protein [Actinomycetes bacterium]